MLFDVQVFISDFGYNSKHFATPLRVSFSKSYFNVNSEEIIYMFDSPHLLKATKNNFFDKNFNLEIK